ncbi:MAG TPA: DUF1493 family protein [Bacteroidales bacterium]|nr:DUF1493 family protein [Bacteroidales bacterium]HSA44797.1 DUF1493 family protein [Bacteroidales bacterium]
MTDSNFDNIKSFVEEIRWKYPFELQRETRVEQDLGLTGDEAYEFMETFSKRFSIDITNFEFSNYFEPEGDKILPAIIRLFTGKKKEKKKVLTLGDLEKAIESKILS